MTESKVMKRTIEIKKIDGFDLVKSSRVDFLAWLDQEARNCVHSSAKWSETLHRYCGSLSLCLPDRIPKMVRIISEMIKILNTKEHYLSCDYDKNDDRCPECKTEYTARCKSFDYCDNISCSLYSDWDHGDCDCNPDDVIYTNRNKTKRDYRPKAHASIRALDDKFLQELRILLITSFYSSSR